MVNSANDRGKRSVAASVLRFLTMIGLVLLSFEPANGGDMNRQYHSEINKYPNIFLFDVVESQPGRWDLEPGNPLNEQRKVKLQIVVAEVFKSHQGMEAGQGLRIAVGQKRPSSGRIADYYGPWSDIELESNPRLLAFCEELPSNVEQGWPALECPEVVEEKDPARPFAAEDVEKAMDMKELPSYPNIVSARGVRESIEKQGERVGPLLARFLLDAAEAAGLDVSISGLIALVGTARINGLFRSVLLTYLADALVGPGDENEGWKIRFVRAMSEILQEPRCPRVLREGIVQAYFRNTVFDASGNAFFPSRSVFETEEEIESLKEAILSLPFEEQAREQILTWLSADR